MCGMRRGARRSHSPGKDRAKPQEATERHVEERAAQVSSGSTRRRSTSHSWRLGAGTWAWSREEHAARAWATQRQARRRGHAVLADRSPMVAGRGTPPGHGQRRDGRGDEAARCRRRGASRRRGRMNQASTRSANGGGGARRLLQLMHSSEAQQGAHAAPENKQPASAGDQPARREPAGHRAVR
jgi:hypothetical protein